MKTNRLAPALGWLAAVGILLSAGSARGDGGHDGAGAVFALGNEATGNTVHAFARDERGALTARGAHPTGGLGTSAGLGSQGSLVTSRDGRFLFAVDAGSNEITSFRIRGAELELAGHVPSGGVRPVSLTAHGRLLYVLNAGGAGNIAGFLVGPDGALTPLPGSSRPLSSPAASAAQVQFSPHGDALVVTERATSRLSLYAVARDGTAAGPTVFDSSGTTPFGFAFTRRGDVVVSEAASGAVSSYSLEDDGAGPYLDLVSGSVSEQGEAAPCWLVTTASSRFAFVANAGTASISAFHVARDGALTLLASKAADVPRPLEMSLSRGSEYLYVVNGGAGRLSGFAVGEDGTLRPAGGAEGLPTTLAGVAAR
jgi:6-phosphogluconolactonase (cycloisomerase 2 family)